MPAAASTPAARAAVSAVLRLIVVIWPILPSCSLCRPAKFAGTTASVFTDWMGTQPDKPDNCRFSQYFRQRVVANTAAANRDPAVYDDPDPPRHHPTAPQPCRVGTRLARIELAKSLTPRDATTARRIGSGSPIHPRDTAVMASRQRSSLVRKWIGAVPTKGVLVVHLAQIERRM